MTFSRVVSIVGNRVPEHSEVLCFERFEWHPIGGMVCRRPSEGRSGGRSEVRGKLSITELSMAEPWPTPFSPLLSMPLFAFSRHASRRSWSMPLISKLL
jgi:hypothetical protein